MREDIYPVEEEEEEDDSSGWLTSYADLMTLVACFFILMMAFANFDPVVFSSKTREVAKHFNEDKHKARESKEDSLMDEIERSAHLKKFTSVSKSNGELEITLTGGFLFESGGFKLAPKMVPMIDSLVDIIKDKNPNYRIFIEGHTDDLPVSPSSQFTSNWALSGARAASIAERFEFYGFIPQNLKVLAMGSTRPQLPHRDNNGEVIKENLKVNRRVVIKVLEPVSNEAAIRLGLGVYFDD